MRRTPARGNGRDLDARQELGVALARLTWRRLFVRLVAITTCLVALAGIGASAYVYRQVGQAERAAQQQLLQIGATFDEVAASTMLVSASIDRAAVTTDEAKVSLDSASQASRSAATTLDDTAKVINFTIPGLNYRPLQGVDTSFREQATQLRTLARDIDQTGGALNRNAGDLRAIGKDVTEVSRDLERVSVQLRAFAGSEGSPGGLAQITNGTRLIISWSVIVHLLLFGMGVALFLLSTEPRYVIQPAPPANGATEYDIDDLEAELSGKER